MNISNTRSTARAVLALLLAAFITLPQNVDAGSLPKTNNPWHMITDHELDDDHGHVLRQSPFDQMNEMQLAAVPAGNRIHYNAPSKCVPTRLKAVLKRVSAKYGPITVNSTYRSPSKNRKIGGKKKSYHLQCSAVDFRVHASSKGLLSYLRAQPEVGGYKRYKSGFYHIDNGPKRTW